MEGTHCKGWVHPFDKAVRKERNKRTLSSIYSFKSRSNKIADLVVTDARTGNKILNNAVVNPLNTMQACCEEHKIYIDQLSK